MEEVQNYMVGDIVDSIGGHFKGGEVLEIETNEIGWKILTVRWKNNPTSIDPNGLVQKRASSIVRLAGR